MNKIKKNKENIEKIIYKLPLDIQRYIFHTFFKVQIYYEEFLFAINLQISKEINIIFIRPFIPYLLTNNNLLNYIDNKILDNDNNKFIKHIFQVYKLNVPYYKNLTNGDGISTAILIHLYH